MASLVCTTQRGSGCDAQFGVVLARNAAETAHAIAPPPAVATPPSKSRPFTAPFLVIMMAIPPRPLERASEAEAEVARGLVGQGKPEVRVQVVLVQRPRGPVARGHRDVPQRAVCFPMAPAAV